MHGAALESPSIREWANKSFTASRTGFEARANWWRGDSHARVRRRESWQSAPSGLLGAGPEVGPQELLNRFEAVDEVGKRLVAAVDVQVPEEDSRNPRRKRARQFGDLGVRHRDVVRLHSVEIVCNEYRGPEVRDAPQRRDGSVIIVVCPGRTEVPAQEVVSGIVLAVGVVKRLLPVENPADCDHAPVQVRLIDGAANGQV